MNPQSTSIELICGLTWEEIQARQQKQTTIKPILIQAGKDYGFDPVGDGTYRLVPSGRIVTKEERIAILGR